MVYHYNQQPSSTLRNDPPTSKETEAERTARKSTDKPKRKPPKKRT